MRIFSSRSKLAAVLYWVVSIILKIYDQFEIPGRIQSDNRENQISFIVMKSTFHTLFGAISKRIELQSCAWSRIVDNLIQFFKNIESISYNNYLLHQSGMFAISWQCQQGALRKKRQPKSYQVLPARKTWIYFQLSTIQDQVQLSSSIYMEIEQKMWERSFHFP